MDEEEGKEKNKKTPGSLGGVFFFCSGPAPAAIGAQRGATKKHFAHLGTTAKKI